jgi:hypothetical protein
MCVGTDHAQDASYRDHLDEIVALRLLGQVLTAHDELLELGACDHRAASGVNEDARIHHRSDYMLDSFHSARWFVTSSQTNAATGG